MLREFRIILELLSHSIYRLPLVINAELLTDANMGGFLSSTFMYIFDTS